MSSELLVSFSNLTFPADECLFATHCSVSPESNRGPTYTRVVVSPVSARDGWSLWTSSAMYLARAPRSPRSRALHVDNLHVAHHHPENSTKCISGLTDSSASFLGNNVEETK